LTFDLSSCTLFHGFLLSSVMKICPSCNQDNADGSVLCSLCGGDLSSVPVVSQRPTHIPQKTERTVEEPQVISVPSSTPPALSATKKCPKCGTDNPSFRSRCSSCVEELPEIASPPSTSTVSACSGKERRKLHLVVGAKKWECQPSDRLGREGSVACEAFTGIDTVSRQHISLAYEGGEWRMTPLSGNKTWLSGKELVRGVAVPLLQGKNEVRLSSRCTVTLEVE